ncbi:zinc finger protein 37-like isoform X2 [Metopolophium dirhodum]|uniref:zinc finger protein 37-like isoform X2 n=1 Tax=Metopolophium dirhodum TaxID=44670 RepID=UPI00298FAD58|nr:zinc finger protein 37-like isoform X2 [Metopolophium dirhodum]
MVTITEDFVTIANIIKHEIHRRKKQKKLKENLKNVEEDNISLFKKKKKKKKQDTTMIRNGEIFNNDIVTLQVEKFCNETCDDNDNFYEDKLTRSLPIANDSEGDSLFKKKKKKKKGDKKMVQNEENINNDIVTLRVDKFYNKTCDDNYKHMYKDETMDSNFNKDESTRKIPMSNASEGDSLFKKKKKKKKKGDKKMVKNCEKFKQDKFYSEICDDNDKHLYKDETMDSYLNKDELIRIPIANTSEGDSLFKKKKKKKNSDKKMVQKDKHLKNDKSILNGVQFYNETIDDNIKYLNKINMSVSNLNKDFTTRIQIANASEDDKELTLLKSPFKKIKKKKKKFKMAINDGTQSTKYGTTQKNLKNMEDLKKNVFKEQPNEIHNDSGMINNPYNSRISKVHEQYPELFQKLLKKKKKDKKKSIKVVTSKEVLSPKKSNKHKREATDKEYSKNNSRQSVDMDIETYDSNNYIGGNKLKSFYSQDDHMPEYRTMTDIDSNMSNTIYNSRISKVDKEEYPELVKKSLKNKKRENKKAIKAVNRNEVMLQKKSNKHKRQTTDKEYSKNDSPQSVDINVETCYDNINHIGEDFGNKLELVDSRDDHPSEYRNIIDTVMYLGQYCNQIFNNANGVFIHENVLTGNIPLQCDVCFRTFSYKSKLYLHKRTHTGEKPYVCNVCSRSFSLKSNLVTHKRTHTGEKPYVCNVCGQSFSRKGNLVTHKRTHTGEKPYVCNVCGQSFSQKGNLVTHKRTHTGEKPYACNVCGRLFSYKGDLVKHIRTHTGEKPYACNYCGRSFSLHGNLVTHIRTHTGVKPYTCNFCGRSFSQKVSCVVHYRIHTGEKPFECGYCEKKFSSSGDRTKHTRNVHTKCF